MDMEDHKKVCSCGRCFRSEGDFREHATNVLLTVSNGALWFTCRDCESTMMLKPNQVPPYATKIAKLHPQKRENS